MVTRVGVSLDGLFKQIDVRTHVDFGGLRDVFVVTRLVPWQEQVLYRAADQQLLRTLEQNTDAAAQASRRFDSGER